MNNSLSHKNLQGWNESQITSSSRQTFSIPLLFSSSCKAVTAAELPGTLQTFNKKKHNVEVSNQKDEHCSDINNDLGLIFKIMLVHKIVIKRK